MGDIQFFIYSKTNLFQINFVEDISILLSPNDFIKQLFILLSELAIFFLQELFIFCFRNSKRSIDINEFLGIWYSFWQFLCFYIQLDSFLGLWLFKN